MSSTELLNPLKGSSSEVTVTYVHIGFHSITSAYVNYLHGFKTGAEARTAAPNRMKHALQNPRLGLEWYLRYFCSAVHIMQKFMQNTISIFFSVMQICIQYLYHLLRLPQCNVLHLKFHFQCAECEQHPPRLTFLHI